MELADVEVHRPGVDRAAPVLAAVLDQALQEQRIRVARAQRQHAVRGDACSGELAGAEEHEADAVERRDALLVDGEDGLVRRDRLGHAHR